ncbi:MAG TPA: hypothetical protein VFQ02_06540, partial [Nitrospira sp.]|nr:hypothetical protein [Nitrospira sp.]
FPMRSGHDVRTAAGSPSVFDQSLVGFVQITVVFLFNQPCILASCTVFAIIPVARLPGRATEHLTGLC